MEDAASLRDSFLNIHPAGWCTRGPAPLRKILNRESVKENTRFAVCDCLETPLFLKSLHWDDAMAPVWEAIPDSIAFDAPLHRNAYLLSPLFHLRTEREWIRVFPYWATDLATLFSMTTGARMPSAHAFRILNAVLSGLAALEEVGIIHRDLKPSNILIRTATVDRSDLPPFDVVLSDFSDNRTSGTPYWAPPELCGGGCDFYGPLFAFGLVVWDLISTRSFRKMLKRYLKAHPAEENVWPAMAEHYLAPGANGRSPFQDESEKLLTCEMPRIEAPRETPEKLLELVHATIRWNPRNREAALAALLAGEMDPHRPAAAVWKWMRRECGADFSERVSHGERS